MAPRLVTIDGKANLTTEQAFGKSRSGIRPIEAVMQKARALYRSEIIRELAKRTGRETRTVEYWCQRSGGREMDRDSFINLLLDDDGFKILEAIMQSMPARERPAWWRAFSRHVRRSEIRKLQAELKREIDALDEPEFPV